MAKNKIDDLRDHLFATIEALRDEEKPMDLDRAKVIAEVAKEITASAQVEVNFLRATGQTVDSKFFARPSLPPPGARPALVERDAS